MKMKLIYFFLSSVTLLLCASCATEKKVTRSELKKDAFGRPLNFSIGKDKEGNPVMQSDLRSSFEGKKSRITQNRDFRGQDYTKKSYRYARWQSTQRPTKKDHRFTSKKYNSSKEPWFVKKQSVSGQENLGIKNKKYTTFTYKKNKSSEQNMIQFEKYQDLQTEQRRKLFSQPEVIHWKQKDNELSIQDTNKLLGR